MFDQKNNLYFLAYYFQNSSQGVFYQLFLYSDGIKQILYVHDSDTAQIFILHIF